MQLKVKQTDHRRNGEVELGVCKAIGFRDSWVSVTNDLLKIRACEETNNEEGGRVRCSRDNSL